MCIDKLRALIQSLEGRPHLSLKEEMYLQIAKELLGYKQAHGEDK